MKNLIGIVFMFFFIACLSSGIEKSASHGKKNFVVFHNFPEVDMNHHLDDLTTNELSSFKDVRMLKRDASAKVKDSIKLKIVNFYNPLGKNISDFEISEIGKIVVDKLVFNVFKIKSGHYTAVMILCAKQNKITSSFIYYESRGNGFSAEIYITEHAAQLHFLSKKYSISSDNPEIQEDYLSHEKFSVSKNGYISLIE